MNDWTKQLMGSNGCNIVDDTSEHTIKADTIVVMTDTVIGTLEVNDVSVLSSTITDGKYNLTGKTLPAGFLITKSKLGAFTKITLTSGSVEIFNTYD